MSGFSRQTLNSVRDNRGVALLICLLIMAILTVVVLEFHYEVQVDAALKNNSFLALKAEYAARSGVAFCKALLRKDAANDLMLPPERRTDSLTEEWALAAEPIQVDEGILVTTRIIDQDGKFCINRVLNAKTYKANGKAVLALKRLLTEFEMPVETTDAVLDWVDMDSVQRPAGAEDGYYRGLSLPYLCKNGWLDSMEELALVKGFTQEAVFGQHTRVEDELSQGEVMPALADYLSVFGAREGRINVNTAAEPVLRAVFGQDTPVASNIVSGRQSGPFESMADLKQRVPAVIGIQEAGKSIAFRSNTFSIISEGVVYGMPVRIDTVVERFVPQGASSPEEVGFRTLAWKVRR